MADRCPCHKLSAAAKHAIGHTNIEYRMLSGEAAAPNQDSQIRDFLCNTAGANMPRTMSDPHLKMVCAVTPGAEGCEDCLRIGSTWVHLRLCLTCGHVGCCDSSPNRHARAHYHETQHPIIRSFQPGENWRWCYIDDDYA